eukprot:gene15760-11282_t
MATEDTRISDLEKVIKVYESEYTTASAEDKRLLLLQLITAKQETLNRLLAEKKAPSVGASVKPGTVSDSENLTYFTSVAMPNPSQFRQFLTFKYLETKGLQRSDDRGHVLAKLSRVRAEVKQTMEQSPDITIDLNSQLKNKRKLAALGVVDT